MAKQLTYEEQLKANGVTQADIDRIAGIFGVTPSGPAGPSGSVLGASTSQPSNPASYTLPGTDVPFRNDEQASLSGYNGPQAQNAVQNSYAGSGFGVSVPVFSAQEAQGFANTSGFSGIKGVDKQFVGLTKQQAAAKAKELSDFYGKQTSQNTSYNYNPETIAGFNKAFKELKFKVDESNANPWNNDQAKKDSASAMINSYTDRFASLFQSPQDFQAAMQNPDFQNTIQSFRGMGGDVNAVASRIGKGNDIPQQQNPDGSMPSNPNQTLDEYLGAISDPNQQKAMETLMPEKQIAQEQIALENQIPEQYRKYYFGSEEEIGFIQQQRQQKAEEIKLIERKAELDKDNTSAQASYLIEKNNAELAMEEAQIEENRLSAKNYMTGMLAKLGALNTTGAAPEALSKLDTQYKLKSSNLRTNYSLANKQIQLKLNEAVDKIAIDRDENILNVKNDLSKDEEQVWKEVIKLQSDADRKTLTILDRFSSDFRTQTQKYASEAKSDAEKYVKDFVSYAGKGYDMNSIYKLLSGTTQGVQVPAKKKAGTGTGVASKWTKTERSTLERAGLSTLSDNDKTYFLNTEPAFRQWFTRKASANQTPATLEQGYAEWQKEKKASTSKGREI